jgi:hypothetical protein
MAQDQTQNYPVRAIPLEERLIFTYIKLTKPQYAPYLATIQSVMNQYIVPYTFFALAVAQGTPDDTLLQNYTAMAKAKINEVLAVFGVNFDVTYSHIQKGLKLTFEAQKGGNTSRAEHEIAGRGPNFGPLYAQSKDIAKVRWAAYTELVQEDRVHEILELANMGYEVFMLEGTPTPRQIMAALKHKIKLMTVDPAEYIRRLKESVDKYEYGYQHGVMKYSYISPWLSDGLVAAVKATGAVYQVL